MQQSRPTRRSQTRSARIIAALCCNTMEATTRPRWMLWVGVAVVAHCVLGISRIPHAVIGKRWREVAEFQDEGGVAWRLRVANLEGVDVIEELRRTTPPDAVIVTRGAFKGVLEYAPRLLWPRLCCSETLTPADEIRRHDRPIAPVILVSEGGLLRLEQR